MKTPPPMLLIFVGATIAVIGTFIAAFGTYKQNIASSEKSKLQLEKLEDLTEKNKELGKQLSETTNEIKNNITGGDSYCVINLIDFDETGGSLSAYSQGNYNLYDYSVRVVDNEESAKAWERVRKEPKLTGPNGVDRSVFEKSEKTYPIGNISPQSSVPIGHLNFIRYGNYRSFTFLLSGRNGFFVQKMIYAKVGDKWYFANRMTTGDLKKPVIEIFKYIEDGFPSNKLVELEKR